MSSLNVERVLKKDHVLDALAQGLLHNQKENNAQTTHLTGKRENLGTRLTCHMETNLHVDVIFLFAFQINDFKFYYKSL